MEHLTSSLSSLSVNSTKHSPIYENLSSAKLGPIYENVEKKQTGGDKKFPFTVTHHKRVVSKLSLFIS